MNNQILIHLGEQGWLATFKGPHAAEIVELFESDTIPLPYTAAAPLAVVIAETSKRSPGVEVKHWNDGSVEGQLARAIAAWNGATEGDSPGAIWYRGAVAQLQTLRGVPA